jgi:hypothetical protein
MGGHAGHHTEIGGTSWIILSDSVYARYWRNHPDSVGANPFQRRDAVRVVLHEAAHARGIANEAQADASAKFCNFTTEDDPWCPADTQPEANGCVGSRPSAPPPGGGGSEEPVDWNPDCEWYIYEYWEKIGGSWKVTDYWYECE